MSLGILLLPVGILTVWQCYKQGFVDVKIVRLVPLGFLVGDYFGSKLALMLPEALVRKIFAGFLIVITIKLLFFNTSESKSQHPNNQFTEVID